MLFNSVEFLFFFPIIVVLFFSVPTGVHTGVLLLGSLLFYGVWNPNYIPVIVGLGLADYLIGLGIAALRPRAIARFALALGICANLGTLFVFKYLGLFVSLFPSWNSGHASGYFALLPLGLSFHVFQSISYIVDVARGRIPAERNLWRYLQFILFFPQLVAGPIERAEQMLPQFRLPPRWVDERVTQGLLLMAWGFFKKLIIADRLALLADWGFDSKGTLPFPASLTWLVILSFSVQIYCDFSGYSDIARGAARILGFKLSINFDRPYLATSLRDFWNRWHKTLSGWFKDYAYIPLGGSRRGIFRTMLNILIVFAISGLWHGAAWQFAAWGLIHGLLLSTELFFKWITQFGRNASTDAKPNTAAKILRCIVTFGVVSVAWIPFRASSLNHAVDIFLTLFRTIPALPSWSMIGSLPPLTLPIAFAGVLVVCLVEVYQELGFNQSTTVRWENRFTIAATSTLIMSLLFFSNSNARPFIYFQF